MFASRPAVYHASDMSPVTSSSPARSGEVLAVAVRGAGPVRPTLAAGAVFASEPFHQVTSPVTVLIGERAAPGINAIGWPGTPDVYRVDFRVTEGSPAGLARVRISVAWIDSSEIAIPVR
jgi:uncharacterized protein (TIGR03437 family)